MRFEKGEIDKWEIIDLWLCQKKRILSQLYLKRRMKNAKHEQLPDLRKSCPRS